MRKANMSFDLDLYLRREKERVDRALIDFLPQGGPEEILSAMRYSLEAGGKRLRPILTLATAETLGSADDGVMEVACALEMIHTYSLIHDDLPAMDDSDLRRGKPTCHRIYGDAMAVLAGDGLLTLAFALLTSYAAAQGREKKGLRMMAETAAAAGINGMIGGQVLDLRAEGTTPKAEQIRDIMELKTGALLRAAVRCGALAADASNRQLEALDSYARHLGTAFQIVDDLLDLESTAEELGKPVGADLERAKATFPAHYGRKEARRMAEDLHRRAVAALSELERPAEILEALADKLVYRKN